MLLIRSKINITNLSFHRLLKPRTLLLLAASSLLLGSFNAAHGTETGSNARSISNTTTTLPEQQATDIKTSQSFGLTSPREKLKFLER